MTHREKVDCLIDELCERGMKPALAAPPMFRLFWALGLEVPPPLFLGFLPLTFLFGGFFGFFWGLGMALFFLAWLFQSGGFANGDLRSFLLRGALVVAAVAVGAVMAGVLFGLTMAGYTRWKAGKLGLPAWEDYPDGLAWSEWHE